MKIVVTDLDGVLRGKIISKEKCIEALNSSLCFCDVIFGWDINDACYTDTSFSGWHKGYPDLELFIDENTIRYVPWDGNIPLLIADLSGKNTIDSVCPRTLLKNVAAECKAMGYNPLFAHELEWYNFKEDAQTLKEKSYKNISPLTSGMFGYSILRPTQYSEYFNSIHQLMLSYGIPIEGMHTETGPGVYEAAIKYDSILNAADKSVLFKAGVKEIAAKHGIMASFMAKWNMNFPGSGGHIHQSIWDAETNHNIFYDATDKYRMSEKCKQYLAGQLYCLPFILPMYAPSINSYKRLLKGTWAPTTVSWGIDNRTASLRLINRDEHAIRVETRVPGADVNPYLGMAASLASGLYGIKHKLKLKQKPVNGNAYSDESLTALPSTLLEAVDKMKSSSLPQELFGKTFTKHFIQTRQWEIEQYKLHVSEWELNRYLEIV
ncbi:MAG: glutamine synthetase [Bacteroidales bacterium]|nr:glutamine synthetase [Bacteroidales bacterium]